MTKIYVEKCTRCERTEAKRWHRKKTDNPICSTCYAKEWRGKNPEIAKARSKKQNHSKNSKEARKRYQASDRYREVRNKWFRDRYWEDPEAARDKNSKTRSKNPNYIKEYYAKNRASYHERAVRRMKSLNKATLNGTYRDETVAIYDTCPEGYEVDHIVPIKGKDFRDGNREHVVCGLHVPWNLQYLTRTNNRKKGCNLYWCASITSEDTP